MTTLSKTVICLAALSLFSLSSAYGNGNGNGNNGNNGNNPNANENASEGSGNAGDGRDNANENSDSGDCVLDTFGLQTFNDSNSLYSTTDWSGERAPADFDRYVQTEAAFSDAALTWSADSIEQCAEEAPGLMRDTMSALCQDEDIIALAGDLSPWHLVAQVGFEDRQGDWEWYYNVSSEGRIDKASSACQTDESLVYNCALDEWVCDFSAPPQSEGTCVVDTFGLQTWNDSNNFYSSVDWSGERAPADYRFVGETTVFQDAELSWSAGSIEECAADIQDLMQDSMAALCQDDDVISLAGGRTPWHLVAKLGFEDQGEWEWYDDYIYDGRIDKAYLAGFQDPTTSFNCATETWTWSTAK